ncbi:MAG: hypothetical protein LBG81_04990, partial [Coriobacteriaceae bacterium]|nr:hypothetical protein [Coriobacteriaceae bacterium]
MDFDPVAYISEPHWLESRLGLDRIQGLLDSLGKPQERLRFVHVAGTNGKGSTCAFLAHILQEAGFRTGLFTSPHIMEFSDRIQVDGTPISSDELLSVTLAVKEKADAMSDHPTEFEIMTAVALEHFARRKCDIVVFEVGLGGRLDATNVVDAPELCVITPVGFDHTEVLGTTLGAIAWEKAGIIKQGVPLVSWPQEKEAMDVISQAAAERQAKLTIVDFACLSVSANAGFKAPRAIDGVQAKNDESAPKGTGQAHASGNAEAEAQAEAERGSQAASPDMHGGHVSRETF